MFETWLVESAWGGPLVASLLLVVDYVLTIVGARSYRKHVAPYFAHEGSFELNPYYEKDVDRLRWFSGRLVAASAILALALLAIRWLDRSLETYPLAYSFALGIVILRAVPVYVRHFRMLYLARTIRSEKRLEGRVWYPRPFSLRLSAFEFAAFAGIYLLMFLLRFDVIMLGGAVGCLAVAFRQLRKARRYVPPPGTSTSAESPRASCTK